MDLFTYLMAKKGHNTGRDLFSYLLGKNAGGSGTYTTFSGISLNISNTVFGKIKNFMLNSTELTQDGTPTPSSPVDVNVIKGDNTINIKNKNLFNSTNWRKTVSSGGYPLPNNDYSTIVTSSTNNIEFSTLAYGGIESDFFPVKSGETYTISFSGTLPNRFFVTQYNSSKQRLSTLNSSSAQVQATTFTTTADGYIAIGFNNTTISSDNFIINNLQLEIGSTATDYVEHQEQNYPISLGNLEYCKIGNYADQIFKNTADSPYYDNTLIENEWYLKKNIQKTIINKNTLADLSYNNTSYSVPALLVAKSNFGRSSSWGAGYTLTNTYKEITSTSGVATGVFASNFSQNYIWFFNNDFTSSQTALDILDGTIVYIVRTTPTYIHISQTDYPTLRSQLEDIYNNSKSYNGQTNITQTNDDLPFDISVDVLVGDE